MEILIKNFPKIELHRNWLLLFCLCLAGQLEVWAQFTVSEDFRGNGTPEILIGDQAYLTSGNADPVNAGWLRLTEDVGNQKGYAFINKSFPSSFGVLVDFEYKMWRFDDSDVGADGIGVFLFDGTYDETNFKLGGYGGSLGYAPNGDQGVTGGYIGIGLDAYGNFSNPTEGRVGGPGEKPNAIVLRGPTTSDLTTTNRYLGGIQFDASKRANELDYNEPLTARPNDDSFYRRVQIEINPTEDGFYDITIRWTKSKGGILEDILNYRTQNIPPDLLKVGFAASTGGSYNFHEIRNLFVSTPKNLRVVKKADKDLLRSVSDGVDANKISYSIEVVNDTDGPLIGVSITDKITDGNGNIVPAEMFSISEISHTGFDSTTLPNTSATNEFSGTLNLAGNSTGRIIVTGILSGIPAGNILINTTSVLGNEIVDKDLSNNTSVVHTPVIAEGVDLVMAITSNEPCLDPSNGNEITLSVSNQGTQDLDYSTTNKIVVEKVFPAGVSLDNRSHPGWDYQLVGTVHTFTKSGNGTLQSGLALPPISFTLYSSQNFTGDGEVKLISAAGVETVSTEPIENQGNNSGSFTVSYPPMAPVVQSPVYYCLNEQALPLTATSAAGNEMLWYIIQGGAGLPEAYIPNTSQIGTTTYFVSQTNGNCESELTEVQVIVQPIPAAGTLVPQNQDVCVGSVPAEIGSSAEGTVAGTASISYRWESSVDNGVTWETISGASSDAYQPGQISQETRYRRITIANEGGASCESEFTNEVRIGTKICSVITNPSLPSKNKQ